MTMTCDGSMSVSGDGGHKSTAESQHVKRTQSCNEPQRVTPLSGAATSRRKASLITPSVTDAGGSLADRKPPPNTVQPVPSSGGADVDEGASPAGSRLEGRKPSLTAVGAQRRPSLVHFHPVPHLVACEARADQQQQRSGDPHDELRLRNFETTKRGRIVNRGDSFRRLQRNRSAASEASANSPVASSTLQRSITLPSMPSGRLRQPVAEPGAVEPLRRVLLMGASGVGKSALCTQFQTSEYTNGREPSAEWVDVERLVTVCLDQVEMELHISTLTTHTATHLPEEATLLAHDALLVVYSVADVASFASARQLCQLASRLTTSRPVILAANKCDLVRLRKVTAKEGRALAVQFGFKYTETSVVINSNIDELLGGVVAQIRFYQQQFVSPGPCADVQDPSVRERRLRQRKNRIKSRTLPAMIVREIFLKVVGQKDTKSCENLLTV